MFYELINAEYFMKTLNITRMLVSQMTAATKLLKKCLPNMFYELINAEYFMKTLNITRIFVSRITVATKLLKMCLSNILIDDVIFKR